MHVMSIALLAGAPGAIGCGSMHIHCWLACNNPPAIATASDAIAFTRTTRNRALRRLDRDTGFLTTTFGKRLGIRGWKDYGFRVRVTGRVYQEAQSNDGLRTVDLEIDEFVPPDFHDDLACHRYIRVEMFPRVASRVCDTPAGQRLQVEGDLRWDADGFLEMHPRRPDQVIFLPQPCTPRPSGTTRPSVPVPPFAGQESRYD